MLTNDLFKINRTAKRINEGLSKTFGRKIDLQSFDLEKLQDARNKLRTQISQIRGQSGFNENLENDAFHQAQWMLDAINSEIAEREEFAVDASTAEASYEESRMSDIDIDLQSLADRGDEEDLIAALDGDLGPGTADVLKDMMEELKDELASKGMNDVINDEDKMIEMLWDKIVDEYGGRDDSDEGGETDDNYALSSAGFGSDEDYESFSNEAWPGTAEYKAKFASDKEKHQAKYGKSDVEKIKPYGYRGASGSETDDEPAGKPKGKKSKKESFYQGEDMRKVTEGEIQQASAIVTAKTMVDRVSRWIEELSGMENDTLLQLGDSIRDEMGQEAAKNFISTVAPAIQQALENLKGARETLSTGVRALTGEEQPAEMLGGEPAAGGAEQGSVEPDAMNAASAAEPAADQFAAAEPAAGGAEAAGREQRESIEHQHKLLRVLAG
jgi:hypothetical protein